MSVNVAFCYVLTPFAPAVILDFYNNSGSRLKIGKKWLATPLISYPDLTLFYTLAVEDLGTRLLRPWPVSRNVENDWLEYKCGFGSWSTVKHRLLRRRSVNATLRASARNVKERESRCQY